ncbi:MAG: ion transporter [Eubacterium sp.]|nr:ion transporter [Candidatus Colimonas fimequi]
MDMGIREQLYQIVRPHTQNTKLQKAYDIFMIIVILISIAPLCMKEEPDFYMYIEKLVAVVFITDYLVRWITADFLFGKKGISSFVRYPFTFMAIVDFISIVPCVMVIYPGLKAFRLFRLVRAMRVLSVLRIFRYSKQMKLVLKAIESQKGSLLAVVELASVYIFVSAIVIFQVEPETFDSFFDALYWSTILLTTIGFGDLVAVTTVGKLVTMLTAFVGIAVIALPAGIITAGYMEELRILHEIEQRRKEHKREAHRRKKELDGQD